jgi:hypothetical protein
MKIEVEFKGRYLTFKTWMREDAEICGTLAHGRRTYRERGERKYGHRWWTFGIAAGQTVAQLGWEGINRDWRTLRDAELAAEAAEDEADPDAWERPIREQVAQVRAAQQAIAAE